MPNETENITQKMYSLLDENPVFVYREGTEVERSKDCKRRNEYEIEAAFYDNQIPTSYSFVLRAICELSWSTAEMIAGYLGFEKSRPENENLCFPELTESTIKKAVRTLVNYGLVNRYHYVTALGVGTGFFAITDMGFQMLRKTLNYRGAKPETLNGIICDEEKFKILSAGYVGTKLSALGYSDKLLPYDANGYFQKLGKVPLYSRIKTEKNGLEYVTLIEPFYYRANPQKFSQADIDALYRERLDVILAFKTAVIEQGKMFRLIALVEDRAGLKKTVDLIHETMPSELGNFYFTSECIMYSYEGDISNAFFRVYEKNGTLKIIACRDSLKPDFLKE